MIINITSVGIFVNLCLEANTSMDEIITYRAFDHYIEANIIKSRLESEEIPCFLEDENIVTLNPLYNLPAGGIKLRVFKNDINRIKDLLNDDFQFQIENQSGNISCPICSSTNVKFGYATKNKFGIISILIAFLFMIYPFQLKKRYHCFNCEEDFKKT